MTGGRDDPTTAPAGDQERCLIPLSAFSPALQRSIDPNSPLPARMMAAKGILLASPRDYLTALYVLTFDPDPAVSQTARASAPKTEPKVLTGLRDGDLHPLVLDFFAEALAGQDALLELIALNPATSDGTIARIAETGGAHLVDLIAQNQLRILRDDRIVRALVQNPATRAVTKDSVLDFCVRSGLVLADVPAFEAARFRVFGADPAAAAAEREQNETAGALLDHFGEALSVEDTALGEQQRVTLAQRILRMSVTQKIKLATLGNKEARTFLLRDANKLVALAAVQSPRITDAEIVALSNSRTLQDDVMRCITGNREWLKIYAVKVNLVNNPKTPVPVSLKLMEHLNANDVKSLARNRNVPSAVQALARKMVLNKERHSD